MNISEEEKKAIEIIKFLQDKCRQENGTGMMPIYRIDDLANAIETVLKLVYNQQKEIEKLKENQIWSEATIEGLKNDFIQKYKIREKIRDLERIIEYDKPTYIETLEYTIEILQELLGE